MATPRSSTPRASTPKPANGATIGPDGQVELKDMVPAKPSIPVEEDIMQLARLGEIGAIQKLFESGKFDANYKDEQGITPLHVCTHYQHWKIGY
jgi:hypothetical protein